MDEDDLLDGEKLLDTLENNILDDLDSVLGNAKYGFANDKDEKQKAGKK